MEQVGPGRTRTTEIVHRFDNYLKRPILLVKVQRCVIP